MSAIELPSQIAALTPESLSNLLKVQGPSETITVKGAVRDVRFWSKGGVPKRCYGRLVLEEAFIKFSVPAETALQDGETVLLHGSLRIQPTKLEYAKEGITHEVMLVGDVVGTWLPRQPLNEPSSLRLERESAPVPLVDFLHEHNPSSLGFLVTDTAWQDIQANAQGAPGLEKSPRSRTHFMKADKFMDDLQKLSTKQGVRGIVIARGGGEGLEVIGNSPEVIAALLACKKPFYVALGHSRDVLLIDKYADQTFSTPSALAQTLAKATALVRDAKNRDATFSMAKRELEQQVSALKEKVAALEAVPLDTPTPVDVGWRNSFLFGLSLGLIAAAVLFGLALWW